MHFTPLLTALFAAFVGVQATLKDCGLGQSVFTIHDQGFSPEPPTPGENATLWIYYEVPANQDVNDGSAEYSISLNGIPFPPTVDPLCSQIVCPQTPGLYNITSTSVWPTGVSGKIVSKISWYDLADTLLLCSELTERV